MLISKLIFGAKSLGILEACIVSFMLGFGLCTCIYALVFAGTALGVKTWVALTSCLRIGGIRGSHLMVIKYGFRDDGEVEMTLWLGDD